MAALTGSSDANNNRINLDEPRFDQTTYTGRAKHFFITTNPLNVFATSSQLDKARQLVVQYRSISQKFFKWPH